MLCCKDCGFELLALSKQEEGEGSEPAGEPGRLVWRKVNYLQLIDRHFVFVKLLIFGLLQVISIGSILNGLG